MNKRYKKVPTRFARETRFEVTPVPAALARGAPEVQLDRAKARLLEQFLKETDDADLHAGLRRAANDAAALAWLTPFPVLFLPVLLEEKVRTAKRQAARQKAILQRGRQSVKAAA